MKVVFFSSTGRMVGGAAMCLKEILPYCLKNGIEPFVILRSDGDFADYLRQLGIRYEVVKYHDWLRPKKDHGGLKNELKWRIKDIENSFAEKKVRKILMREKPDVYHLNVIYNPCGARSAHELGIPVVWHLREFAEIDSNTPFFRNRDKAYNLIAQSEKIVCVSDSIKEFYSQFIPADNMVRIYDGIIMPQEQPTLRERHKVCNITLSGGARVKGHNDLIEAAKMLLDNGHSDFHIKIAGRFADAAYLNSLKAKSAELGLTDKIEFTGFLKDMDSLWAQTDLAVICSRFESFGLSVCEAMARAIPVICANSTGTYEVTARGKYARMYEIGDINTLCDKITQILLNYNSAAEEALQSADYVRKTFSITKSCEELVKVFTDINKSSANF